MQNVSKGQRRYTNINATLFRPIFNLFSTIILLSRLKLCWNDNLNPILNIKIAVDWNYISSSFFLNSFTKISASMLHLWWYANINPMWGAGAALPVIFQKGGLHSNKYFQILSNNAILTIMKTFGVCKNRTRGIRLAVKHLDRWTTQTSPKIRDFKLHIVST